MKLWRWQPGRQQDVQYEKLPLWSFRIWKFGFDAYIIRYKPGTTLPWHKDPVDNGSHYRLNIKLKGYAGFVMRDDEGNIFKRWLNPRVVLFRPDLYEHMVRTRTKTTKLSFRFVKFH